MEEKIKELLKLIEKSKKIMITTHRNPDMDAIGSTVALYWILKALKKENIEMIIEDEQPFKEDFLEGLSRFQNKKLQDVIGDYDLVFLLDASAVDRYTEGELEFENNQKVVRIDHHASDSDLEADLEFVEIKSPSTSELIFNIFEDHADISATAAKAMLAGIYDDTKGFAIQSTSKNTFLTAAALIEKGANIAEIAEYIMQYDDEVLNGIKTIISNLNFDKKYKYAYTYISRDVYELIDMDGAKFDTILNLTIHILLGKKGYRWAVIIRPKDEKSTKLSMRARSNSQNVRKIAEAFGGGGHDDSAGAVFPDIKDPYEALALVRNKIEELLK